MGSVNLSILGSCVSRDVARIVGSPFEVVSYLARQSWISAVSAPVDLPPEPSALSSRFQRKMVEADLTSAWVGALDAVLDVVDWVLFDLVDERFGVYPVGGGYVTRSSELVGSGWLSHLDHGPLVEFGSDEHFALWCGSAGIVRQALRRRGLWSRARVVVAPFAEEIDTGGEAPRAGATESRVWNSRFRRYYEYLAAEGFTLVKPVAEHVLTSHDHLWGPAPFHYVDAFYLDLAQGLIAEGAG